MEENLPAFVAISVSVYILGILHMNYEFTAFDKGMMVEKIVNTSTDVHKIKISEMVDSNIKINDYFTPSLYEILKSKIN
jgi:hypothetical protein